jgi:hypothetical protein
VNLYGIAKTRDIRLLKEYLYKTHIPQLELDKNWIFCTFEADPASFEVFSNSSLKGLCFIPQWLTSPSSVATSNSTTFHRLSILTINSARSVQKPELSLSILLVSA